MAKNTGSVAKGKRKKKQNNEPISKRVEYEPKLKDGQCAVIFDKDSILKAVYGADMHKSNDRLLNDHEILVMGLLLSAKWKGQPPVHGLEQLRLAMITHTNLLLSYMQEIFPEGPGEPVRYTKK